MQKKNATVLAEDEQLSYKQFLQIDSFNVANL